LTREDWDFEWEATFKRLRSKGAELLEAQRLAREITTTRYGARPAGLPLTWRLALGFLERKVKGNPMGQRVLASIMFAFTTGMPLFAAAQQADTPGGASVIGMEWAAIAYVAAMAFYTSYKTNTRVFGLDRKEWTPEERKVETAKMDAGLLVLAAKTVADAKVEDAKAVADAKVAR